MQGKPQRSTAQRVFEGLIPLWAVPGLLDYAYHRGAKIERTSGTHESLTHVLMGAVSATPVLTDLFFETNATVAALAVGAVAVHEGIVLWDVGYANPRRSVSAGEQHVHAFLEVLPFTMLALSASAHPAAFADLRKAWPPRFERRRDAPRPAYVALLASLGALSAIAYVEEFVRCFAVDRTIAPHPSSERS